jgi:polyisoprenoid-binding protein YceI
MSDQAGRQTPARNVPGKSSRKRHWRRWVLAGIGVLVVLVVLAVGAFIKLQPTLSPLVLPTAGVSAPAGPLQGTWDVAAGSAAGFRVPETALGISNDTVGRTNAVTGTIALSGTQVTAAAFRIGLTAIKVGGKAQPQFATSLGTQQHPVATFTLTQPVTLSSAFASGATITATATGQLTMRGISHPVTVTISGRRNGSGLQVAGSIPIAFSDWGITEPKGYGFFGSLANHGVAEFLLVLHRY